MVVPMVQDRPRLNKPPLIYWLQSASARISLAIQGNAENTGLDAIWMYRLPSALAAMLSVLLTWRLGLRMLDSRAAFIGAAGLAVCPLLIVDSHQARADQVMVCITIGAMLALWRLLHETQRTKEGVRTVDAARVAAMSNEAKAALAADAGSVLSHRKGVRPAWWVLWLLVGLGILAKGPITPMVVVLCVLAHCALQRNWEAWKRANPLLGICVALACVLPWVVMVMQQVGAKNYFDIIYDETIGRSFEPKEGHWGPPGYHLLLLTPLLFPITLIAGGAVVHALRDGLQRPTSTSSPKRSIGQTLFAWKAWQADRASLFLIAWLLPTFIVFEFVSTKLPHYPLPVYPAIALLAARAALSLTGSVPGPLVRAGYWLWCVVGCIGLGGVCIALSDLLTLPAWASTIGFFVGFTAILLLVVAAWCATHGKLLRSLLLSAVATSIALATALGVLLPNSHGEKSPWVVRDAAAALIEVERETRRTLAVAAKQQEEQARKQTAQAPGDTTITANLDPDPIADAAASNAASNLNPSTAASADAVPLACADFFEDSLVFLTHGRIKRLASADAKSTLQIADAWLTAHPHGLLLTTSDFSMQLAATQPIHTLHELRGFNHAGGDMANLVIITRSPATFPFPKVLSP